MILVSKQHRRGFTEFAAPRGSVDCHGTGCVLSSAIAARLALGDPPATAVRKAKEFITARLVDSCLRFGAGAGLFHFG